MRQKKYSSYAEIDLELEILELKKDINFHKLILTFQNTKQSFTPQNMIDGILESYRINLSNSYSSILNNVIPYIINFILKRKRGL